MLHIYFLCHIISINHSTVKLNLFRAANIYFLSSPSIFYAQLNISIPYHFFAFFCTSHTNTHLIHSTMYAITTHDCPFENKYRRIHFVPIYIPNSVVYARILSASFFYITRSTLFEATLYKKNANHPKKENKNHVTCGIQAIKSGYRLQTNCSRLVFQRNKE